MNISELAFYFEKQTKQVLLLRAQSAVEHLLGAVQEAYYEVMVGSRGGSGSVGALVTAIRDAESFLEGIIGFGKSGDYLKFTEFGVKPASGAKYDAYTKTPPAEAFAEWIRRARLNIPDKYKSVRLRMHERTRALKRLSRNGGMAAKRFSRIALASTKLRADRARKVEGDPEAKARLRWAWAMVTKRKRFGYKGLRVIERVARELEATIRAILEGTA